MVANADDDDFDLLSEADKEKLRQKANLVDLIDYLREDGNVSFAEIDRRFGVSNCQMWFRKTSKTIPSMENLEKIGKVAGQHHTGFSWSLPQLLKYLKTGKFPEKEKKVSSVENLTIAIAKLTADESLMVIESAVNNLETAEEISRAINICSSALGRIGRNP